MKTIETIIAFIMGCVIGLGVFGFILSIINQADIARLEKHDTCLASLIEQDPNETEARSKELRDCMDK